MNKTDQEFLVSKIRAQYVEKTPTELDELKVLDNRVKRPANVFAYLFGSVAALIMGAGMSLVMTDLAVTLGIANPMLWGVIIGAIGLTHTVALWVGIVVGIVGAVPVGLAFPLYNRIVKKERARIAPEILRLTDELLQQ